jgi:hypothetical protein
MEVLPLYHILISLVDKTSANIQEEKKFYHLRFSLGGQKGGGKGFRFRFDLLAGVVRD